MILSIVIIWWLVGLLIMTVAGAFERKLAVNETPLGNLIATLILSMLGPLLLVF